MLLQTIIGILAGMLAITGVLLFIIGRQTHAFSEQLTAAKNDRKVLAAMQSPITGQAAVCSKCGRMVARWRGVNGAVVCQNCEAK
jgi:hypothetical protein